MTTAKALVDQTGVYSQWTATVESEPHCLIWLRGNATRQIKQTGQRLKVIDGYAGLPSRAKIRLYAAAKNSRIVIYS